MRIPFTKMHGCGNDYIYIDCLSREITSPEMLSIALSDRHTGIGGDGIVLICPSKQADAKMRMFNQDGSEGAMCGNAIRCVAKYLYDTKVVSRSTICIDTLSGIKTIEVFLKENRVTSAQVDMGPAELDPARIPIALPANQGPAIEIPIQIEGTAYKVTCISMGNPHAVVFCEDVEALDLGKLGPLFENHELFPERVNTEFVAVKDDHTLHMRVWERGSGETQACGTGACAAVVAATLNGYCAHNTSVRVVLQGGELIICNTDDTVLMTGNCVKVFEGAIEVVLERTKSEEEYRICEY